LAEERRRRQARGGRLRERAWAQVARYARRSAADINRQDVLSEIETFAEGAVFPDDVCLVGMEISRIDVHNSKASSAGENGLQTAANGSTRTAMVGNH
jgi:hypothetical protein